MCLAPPKSPRIILRHTYTKLTSQKLPTVLHYLVPNDYSEKLSLPFPLKTSFLQEMNEIKVLARQKWNALNSE